MLYSRRVQIGGGRVQEARGHGLIRSTSFDVGRTCIPRTHGMQVKKQGGSYFWLSNLALCPELIQVSASF
jgi:hypothetical protein